MEDNIKETFEWYKIVSEMIASLNNKTTNWKEDVLVDFALHKIRGYNFEKLTPLNNLSYLELIRLSDEFDEINKGDNKQ